MKTNMAYILLASGSLLLDGCASDFDCENQIQPIGRRYRIIIEVGGAVQAEKSIEIRWDAQRRQEETRYLNEQQVKPRFINSKEYLRL